MPALENVNPASAGQIGPGGQADGRPTIGSYVGTVALVGLGVALIEEELLAGMALGVAAMAFPNLAPKLGETLRPLFKSAVRAGYGLASKTRETVAEVSEQFQDVVAEVKAEQEHGESFASAETGGSRESQRAAENPDEHARTKKAGKTNPRSETE